MKIEVPISLGELIDKISILLIKKDKIDDQNKLNLVNDELELLNISLSRIIDSNMDRKSEILNLKENLKKINSKLWVIEDKIRDCERNKLFDNTFTELARSVYIQNDQRAELKRKINMLFDSEIMEVKSYKKY
tara:strand:+ start:440 stop:838 length:399 start_codon:yes stop_codon:yes gene_type:complete